MSLFGTKKIVKKPQRLPQDPQWMRSKRGGFQRLLDLDPEDANLQDRSGVLVIWHTGVQPAWVYVGRSDNLAGSISKLANSGDILLYEERGDLVVSWSFIREKFQDGVAAYLTKILEPKVDNPLHLKGDAVDLIAVYPPGMVPTDNKNSSSDPDRCLSSPDNPENPKNY